MMEVKKFVRKLVKTLGSILLLICLLIGLSNKYILDKNFHQNEVEANLFLFPENKNFDILILGISHGRNFSRGMHHELFERRKGSTLNLSIGEGLNGLEFQDQYASFFLQKNNVADSLFFILTPTLFYSNQPDQSDRALFKEPLRLDFMVYLISYGNDKKYAQLFHYIKSKLNHHWWLQKHQAIGNNIKRLNTIDTSVINAGYKLAYPYGLSPFIFKERCILFEKTISKFKQKKTGIKIIIPPASFGKWPGHDQLMRYLNANKYSVIDLSERIKEPAYYYDHHHLNTKGIKLVLDMM